MSIKDLRKSLELTQKEVSKMVGMPLRTYVNYENDESKKETIKYSYIKEKLEAYGLVDEEHGLLTIDKIKHTVTSVLTNYNVEYCYLFGSYAKGTAKQTSDIDLLISTPLTGMQFFGLIEALREKLNKKVDVISLSSLNDNTELLNDIFKNGIKIYG